jgi:hypothetical protein
MNADDCIDAYRVALHVERPVEGIAALLRHELEHAMQYDADVGQRLHRLYVLAVEVICERVGGLPGGGFLYQLIPVELDANAAAATYVRGRFGEARISMLLAADHPDSAAFRSLVPPPARETLADRMLHFFATIPDLCELRADRERMSFAEILAREWPGADGVWRRFFGTGELSLAGDQ